MKEFLFPNEYKSNNPWDTEMIQEWRNSSKPLLTFSFNRFLPKTLPNEIFWLYLYNTKSSSDDPFLQGKLRFRFQVIDWATSRFPETYRIYYYRSTLPDKVWFLCNRYEELERSSGGLLSYEDFRHPEGKNLGSCLRSSIAPAICTTEVKSLHHYP